MLPLVAILTNILAPALVPALADGARGAFSWLFGGKGAEPQNLDERIKLMGADTDRMKALAELDRPSADISRWVADLRASFRYIAAGLVILTGSTLMVFALIDPTVEQLAENFMINFVSPVWGFMFGERMYMHLKNGGRG